MSDLLDNDTGAEVAAQSTELVVVSALVPAVVFGPGGVDSVLSKLKQEVLAIPRDISTPKGRAAIKSLRYKVARSKTALDEMGKSLVADLKAQTSLVDADRRKIRDELDALSDTVMAELTAWEEADAARIRAHEDALVEISTCAIFLDAPSSQDVRDRLDRLNAMPTREWQEFAHRASQTMMAARLSLVHRLVETEKREAEAAEAERLRQEEIARREAERDAEIARQAAEAARLEAERLAAEEAKRQAEIAAAEQQRLRDEAAAQAEADRLERERIEREALEAADRAAEERARIEARAEADRLAAKEVEERLERERQEAIERANESERQRKLDAEQAEAQKLAAERQAERDRKAAVETERQRQKELADAADRAGRELAAKREADVANKRKVNAAVKDALMKIDGMTEQLAVAVVKAIAVKSVPNVTIAY